MEGYKKKPVLIEVFALMYLLNPIGNLLFSYIISPVNFFPGIGRQILNGHVLTIVVIFFWLTAIPLAYGLYKVRLWAWYYFLIHSVGMFILSIITVKGFQPSYATIVNALFLIPIGYFISHEIRVPYFNPRVRWWEQSARFQHSVKVKLNGVDCTTYDISEEGAFVMQSGSLSLTAGQVVPLEIDLDAIIIKGTADIRWVNSSKGKYPIGYGIQFIGLNRTDRSQIKVFIKSLQSDLAHNLTR